MKERATQQFDISRYSFLKSPQKALEESVGIVKEVVETVGDLTTMMRSNHAGYTGD